MGYLTGIVEFNRKVDECTLRCMGESLKYRCRGENFTSFLSINGASIGISFCLKTTNSSNDVQRSLWNNDKSFFCCFDGAIYNSQELSVELHDSGISIDNITNQELLLILLEKYGVEKSLSKIDGSYNVFIYDVRKDEMFIARDKIGEKPLYYYSTKKCFLFASEIKALYCHADFIAKINPIAVSEYFVFRYASCEDTFIQNVSNLTPGSYIKISKSRQISKHKFWSLPYPKSNGMSFQDNIKCIEAMLHKSVKCRCAGHSTIGTQLSGGIDSSYLCYLASKYCNQLKTYSIIQNNIDFSEEKYSDFVAKTIKLDSQKVLLKTSDIAKYWLASTFHFEAPMNHMGSIAIFLLNKIASNDVTVMINGDGPDEAMGGYDRFIDISRKIKMLSGHHYIRTLLREWKHKKWHFNVLDDYFMSASRFINDDTLKSLRPNDYKSDIRLSYKRRHKLIRTMRGKGLHRYLNYEMMTYGHDVQMRSEKMAGAFGLEARSPYLQADLLTFLQSVNDNCIVNNNATENTRGTKILLKSLCISVFGEDFVYRPKEGLGISLYDVFTDAVVVSYIENDVLPYIGKRGVVNYEYLIYVWRQIQNGCKNYQYLQVVWCACSFEIWAQIFIDSNPNEYGKIVSTIRNNK